MFCAESAYSGKALPVIAVWKVPGAFLILDDVPWPAVETDDELSAIIRIAFSKDAVAVVVFNAHGYTTPVPMLAAFNDRETLEWHLQAMLLMTDPSVPALLAASVAKRGEFPKPVR